MQQLNKLITIIFATSPHRFGESDCMMELNINIIKATCLRGCHMILCADGINQNSEYAEEENSKKYSKYLSNFSTNFPKVQVIKSKEHIGLTRNYMQAWDWKKIKTPFVMLMNHDTVFSDEFLKLDINSTIKNWPDFVHMLMLPRHSEASEWWRERDLSDHPEYKSRNFVKKLMSKNSGWENCKIAFGNQDHACILRKNHLPKLVELYYNPRVTHFLEDSIQRHLSGLENGDFKSWQDFGGCIYKSNISVHIDGQSKAGLSFIQEKNRKGETVWSNGQTCYKDFLKFKELSIINPDIKDSVKKLIKENLKFHKKNCEEAFQKYLTTSNYLVALNKTSELFLGNSANTFVSKKISKRHIPTQNKDCQLHLIFSPNFLEINWEQKRFEKLLLKLSKSCGEKLCWGGHPRGFFNLDYRKHSVSPEDELFLEIYDYTTDEPPYNKIVSTKLSLNIFNFHEDRIVINNNHNFDKCSLHLAKNNGAMAKYSEENNSFEVLYKNISPCQSLVGFFDYQKEEENVKKSITFECKPDPLLVHENPADILLKSFSDFFYSLNKESAEDKNKGKQSYWGQQVDEINKLLKNDT